MEYDKDRYKNLRNPFERIFWFINPLFVINELLGQRTAKIVLEERVPNIPFIERCYTPCPHCNTYHSSRIWSGKNAFMNWFGLYCPTCGNVIPCQMNATSCFILFITYPLWGWFRDKLRTAWLRKQPDRYRNLDYIALEHFSREKIGIRLGLLSALIFIAFQFIGRILEKGYHSHDLISMISQGVLVGFLFGYIMSSYYYKKIKTKNHEKAN